MLLERALALGEATFGPDHPNVAAVLSDLAMVLLDLGDAAGARPLSERAVAIGEAASGPDHPIVATMLSDLAMVLLDLGDWRGRGHCWSGRWRSTRRRTARTIRTWPPV